MRVVQKKTGSDTKTDLRGGKGARAREALMDAGLELLGELSPRDLTAGNICAEAQMKRPSFYTYFDSVDDCLDAMIRREIDRLEALYEAREIEEKSALYRLASIPLSLAQVNWSDNNRGRAIVKLMSSDPAFTQMRMENLRRDVDAAIKEGSLPLERQHIDVFMQIYVAGILSLVARQSSKSAALKPHEDVARAILIMLHGAGADRHLLQEILGVS